MIIFIEKYKKNISRVICGIMALVMALVFPLETYADTVQVDSITSLPADIDVSVENTPDTLYLTYKDNTYEIDKNYQIYKDFTGFLSSTHSFYKYSIPTGWSSASDSESSSGYCFVADHVYYYSYAYSEKYGHAETFPLTFSDSYKSLYGGSSVKPDSSYWFSPSELAVYVVMSPHDGYYRNLVYKVCSFFNNSFYFNSEGTTANSYDSCYIIYKLNLLDMSLIPCESRSDYSTKTVCGLSSGTSYSIYDSDTSAMKTVYYPSDLICIYSTYEISGFYEPDGGNVYTPDYYFQYQYLFYNDGFGYTFIDSACPIYQFTGENTGKSTVQFTDKCNSFIYTSVDGVDWTMVVSTPYKKSQALDYACFYDSSSVDYTWTAVLVYTTDENYGTEPLIPPEYGSITDVTDNLDSFLNDNNIVNLPSRDKYNSLDYICVEDYSDDSLLALFIASFSYDFVYFCTYFTDDVINEELSAKNYPENIHVYYFNSHVPDTLTVPVGEKFTFSSIFSGELSDVNITYYLSNSTKVPTMAMYSRLMNNSLNNIDKQLGAFKIDTYNGLSSIFDNISYSNAYLEKLYNSLSGMPLTLSTGLSSLNDSVLGLGAKLDSVFGGISSGNSKLDSVISAINNLELSVPSSGSGGGGSTDSEYQSILAGYISSIDANVNSIRNWTVAGTVSDWLFDNSEDADSDGDGIVDKYSSLLTSVVSSSVVSTYLTGSLDKIKSWELGFGAVSKLNEGVDLIVSNLGYYNALIFLPPALGLVNLVMRKERLS